MQMVALIMVYYRQHSSFVNISMHIIFNHTTCKPLYKPQQTILCFPDSIVILCTTAMYVQSLMQVDEFTMCKIRTYVRRGRYDSWIILKKYRSTNTTYNSTIIYCYNRF